MPSTRTRSAPDARSRVFQRQRGVDSGLGRLASSAARRSCFGRRLTLRRSDSRRREHILDAQVHRGTLNVDLDLRAVSTRVPDPPPRHLLLRHRFVLGQTARALLLGQHLERRLGGRAAESRPQEDVVDRYGGLDAEFEEGGESRRERGGRGGRGAGEGWVDGGECMSAADGCSSSFVATYDLLCENDSIMPTEKKVQPVQVDERNRSNRQQPVRESA